MKWRANSKTGRLFTGFLCLLLAVAMAGFDARPVHAENDGVRNFFKKLFRQDDPHQRMGKCQRRQRPALVC